MPGVYSCLKKKCQLLCSSERVFLEHLVRKHGATYTDLKCTREGCGVIFNEYKWFINHLKGHEEEERIVEMGFAPLNWDFVCKVCITKFKSPKALNQHFLNQHDKPYRCSLCDASYGKEWYLRQHEASHVKQHLAAAGVTSQSCIPKVVVPKVDVSAHSSKSKRCRTPIKGAKRDHIIKNRVQKRKILPLTTSSEAEDTNIATYVACASKLSVSPCSSYSPQVSSPENFDPPSKQVIEAPNDVNLVETAVGSIAEAVGSATEAVGSVAEAGGSVAEAVLPNQPFAGHVAETTSVYQSSGAVGAQALMETSASVPMHHHWTNVKQQAFLIPPPMGGSKDQNLATMAEPFGTQARWEPHPSIMQLNPTDTFGSGQPTLSQGGDFAQGYWSSGRTPQNFPPPTTHAWGQEPQPYYGTYPSQFQQQQCTTTLPPVSVFVPPPQQFQTQQCTTAVPPVSVFVPSPQQQPSTSVGSLPSPLTKLFTQQVANPVHDPTIRRPTRPSAPTAIARRGGRNWYHHHPVARTQDGSGARAPRHAGASAGLKRQRRGGRNEDEELARMVEKIIKDV